VGGSDGNRAGGGGGPGGPRLSNLPVQTIGSSRVNVAITSSPCETAKTGVRRKDGSQAHRSTHIHDAELMGGSSLGEALKRSRGIMPMATYLLESNGASTPVTTATTAVGHSIRKNCVGEGGRWRQYQTQCPHTHTLLEIRGKGRGAHDSRARG
jgi:hypothetical protein